MSHFDTHALDECGRRTSEQDKKLMLEMRKANQTSIYQPTKPGFYVVAHTLTDGSHTFDVWLKRNDSECLMLLDTAISERHANAIVDSLNEALEIHGVR